MISRQRTASHEHIQILFSIRNPENFLGQIYKRIKFQILFFQARQIFSSSDFNWLFDM